MSAGGPCIPIDLSLIGRQRLVTVMETTSYFGRTMEATFARDGFLCLSMFCLPLSAVGRRKPAAIMAQPTSSDCPAKARLAEAVRYLCVRFKVLCVITMVEVGIGEHKAAAVIRTEYTVRGRSIVSSIVRHVVHIAGAPPHLSSPKIRTQLFLPDEILSDNVVLTGFHNLLEDIT